MQDKECISCHEWKPIDHFYIRASDKRYGAWCLQCDQQTDLHSRYEAWMWRSNTPNEVHRYHALTWELLKYIRAFEHKGCFACGKQNTKGRRLVIDHDHRTNKVRGLLCHSCNVRLGKLHDNPPDGSALAKYILRANSIFYAKR